MAENSVIIIGSGIGGLECAFILAKHGYKVTVLEKERILGGSLQTFVRKGSDGRSHTFDTGFHYVGGLEPKQPLYPLFQYFNLLEGLPWKKLDEDCIDEVAFVNADGDGVSVYPHASGHRRFAERLAEYFPLNKNELDAYSAVLKKIGDKMFDAFHPDSEMFDLFGKPAYDFVRDTISDQRLRDVVCGATMKMELNADTMPMYVYAQATNSFIDSSWRLGYDNDSKLGGGMLLIDRLVRQVRAMGGTILSGKKVVSVHVSEDGNVSGVETADGEVFTADWVISDVHPAVTMDLVDNCRQVKKVFRNRISGLKNTHGIFTANIILKPESLQYMNKNLFVHHDGVDLWRPDARKTESIMVHFYPPEKGKYAESMDVLSMMDWDMLSAWDGMHSGTRGADYEEIKNRKLNECLDLLEFRLPGIRQCIDKVYTSSPVTWHGYTATPDGSAYGVAKDYHNPLLTFLSPRTPLKNLLLTGQSLNLHGILGVSKTAVITCGFLPGMENLEKDIVGY